MNIMVTGSGGQLGSEFRAMAPDYAKWNFFFFSHEDLDVADDEMVAEAMSRCGCDVVINCAAFTSVDKAEADPARSFRVNRDGAGVLARCAAVRSAFLVHFSTYYVFGGLSPRPYRPADHPDSLGVYGISKQQGEELVRKSGVSHMIIRTGWLYSRFGENFVRTMLRLGQERKTLDVVSDRVGSPVYSADLVAAVMNILGRADLQRNYSSTYHYANEGVCSWYDFATAIMRLAELPCRIMPVESSAFKVAGPRPWYSVLDIDAIRKEWRLDTPHWEESLARMIGKTFH
jgi:dTDP-4-dehydrorhamnose reductase